MPSISRHTPSTGRKCTMRIGPGLSALALAAALAGCAAEGGVPLPDLMIDAAPEAHYLGALDTSENQRTELLEARYERWAGGLEERQATAAIIAYYDNAGTSECVAEQGEDFDWEHSIQPADEPAATTGFPELLPPTLSETTHARVNAQATSLAETRTEAPPKALDTAISACLTGQQERVFRPPLLEEYSEEGLYDFLYPPFLSNLTANWAAQVTRVAENLGVSEGDLDVCLSKNPPRTDTFEDLAPAAEVEAYREALRGEIASQKSSPLPGAPANKQWRATENSERELELAAWKCKEPYYDEAISQLNEAMDRFEEQHATQIRKAMAVHSEVKQLATEMGWAPERPIGSLSVEEPAR